MTEKYILSVDLGTSSFRAAAVSADGQIRLQKTVHIVPSRPAKGLSQYEADEMLSVAKQVINEVLEETSPSQAAGLAVSSQRSTVVLWDKTTGKALAPVLTWEDGRSFEEAEAAPVTQEEVHALTGLYKTPYFSAPKIAWCLKNIPPVKEALDAGNLLVAPIASYLVWHLTQGAVFATDTTLAQRMLLLDIRTQTWSEKLCNAFGIPMVCLPALKPSCADYGTYNYKGVCIPVCAMGGDQQMAAAWSNLPQGGSLINYGTGAFCLYNAGEKNAILPGTLTSLAVSAENEKPRYFLEGPVNAAGSALLWLKTQGIAFADEELNDWCYSAQSPVWFLPALGGLGAPYWNFSVSPVFGGLSPLTRREDWVAGVVRSVAYLLADIGHYLQANGFVLNGPLKASGGLSRLAYLVQFQADIMQKEILLEKDTQASVLGAARKTMEFLGWDSSSWKEESATIVKPALPSAEAMELYGKWQAFLGWALKKPL